MKYNWEKGDERIHSIKDLVSKNLGVPDADKEIRRWKEKYENDGYSVVGLTKASTLLKMYGTSEKLGPIRIIGDYDVDGKCAVAILMHTFSRLGYNNAVYRIPRPMSEGYGINMNIVDEVTDDSLVITVDNGIAAIDEMKALEDRKIDVIITDHHLPKSDENGDPVIPNAYMVIDPNAIPASAEFNGYCGAGIAYKLALRMLHNAGVYDEDFEKKLLTLAAIATVCDSVPLVEENYFIVKEGLRFISQGITFEGVNKLLEVFYLTGHCTEIDIGYKLGPAINADNRLFDDSTIAMDLLLADDPVKATDLSQKLKEINEQRKNLVKEASVFAEKVVSTFKMEDDYPLFVNLGSKVKERLVGIIAGKLAEKYHSPTVCFAETEGGIFKGSARSSDGADIHDILMQADSHFLTFGGHKAACGLTLSGRENYSAMKKITQEYVTKNSLRPHTDPVRKWDLGISLKNIADTINELNRYAPFGEGNPMPVIKVSDFQVIPQNGYYFRTMKYDGVKFTSSEGTEAVGFGFASDLADKKPKELVLYGTLGENYFRGQIKPQISFEDADLIREV